MGVCMTADVDSRSWLRCDHHGPAHPHGSWRPLSRGEAATYGWTYDSLRGDRCPEHREVDDE